MCSARAEATEWSPQRSSRKQFPPNINYTERPGFGWLWAGAAPSSPSLSHQQMLHGINWQKVSGRTILAAFGSLSTSKLTSLAKKKKKGSDIKFHPKH